MDHVRSYRQVGENRWREEIGLYFEDFRPGIVIEHRPGRTLTAADNTWQSLICMNQHPLHIDHAYCAHTEFGQPLIASPITLSIVGGLSLRGTSGKGIANLGWQDIKLTAPVFAGDTIYAESTILSVRESKSRPDQGIVECETRGVKADGTLFLSYRRTFLCQKRSATLSERAGY